MVQEYSQSDLRKEIVDAKNHGERKFNYLVDNFYLMRAAIRYFSVRQGLSFSASKIADNFPLQVTVAGSCLSVLTELGVVEPRTESTSPDVYLPRDVNMERMDKVRDILLENHEIGDFHG